MPRGLFSVLLAGCWLLALSARTLLADERRPRSAAEDFFEKKVRPLLTENCLACHGPQKQRGGLRLDSRAGVMTGGDSGPAIVPGKPDESLLIKAVHYTGEPKMPPKTKLKSAQIAALTEWVRQGAPWPDTKGKVRTTPEKSGFTITAKERSFWSFQPISNPSLPKVADTSWPRASLDHFILSALEAKKLRPLAAADGRTLIRRAT
ncbi:MAG TPA: c-type cytochrome domain-containing protein, partial [Gemmataceae bacterium]|nr:c-type cytochrome domain-containing protein [Gemmataceae bacterium]